MKRRDLHYIVIAAMLVSGLYTAVTGLIADLLGLHRFARHPFAGYLCAVLVLVHIALSWRRVLAYVRGLSRRLRGPDSAAEREADEGSTVERRQVIVAALSALGGFFLGWLVPDRGRELPAQASDIGALYHRWSTPSNALDIPLPDWGERPPQYKTYPRADRTPLSDPRGFRGLTVEEALEARRSVRDYAPASLPMDALSRLLHAAQGITEQRLDFRAAPSAGALYPIEIYPVVHNVSGLASGLYHYAVQEHALESLRLGDFRGQVTQAGLYQRFLDQAGVCFLLSALFQRSRWKYRERAYRYVMLEAGHIGQNIYLAATSMGLGACAVGAFYDEQYNQLLGLNSEEEAVVYVISVGER